MGFDCLKITPKNLADLPSRIIHHCILDFSEQVRFDLEGVHDALYQKQSPQHSTSLAIVRHNADCSPMVSVLSVLLQRLTEPSYEERKHPSAQSRIIQSYWLFLNRDARDVHVGISYVTVQVVLREY
jgi:hypothetical protein